MAADLFVVPTVTFRLLFVLVILAHDRRQIVHVAVTEHPTAAWTAQQLRNAFPENEVPRYLLHDRDSVFAHVATTLEGNEHPRGSDGATIAVAERLRGARHRLDPTRVPRSHDRGEHTGPSPRADRLHRVLPALAHTSRPRQGHTGHAPDLTAVGRTYCRHPRSRRSTPPLRPHRRIVVVRRRPQPQPSSITCASNTSVLRWSAADVRTPERIVCARSEESQGSGWALI
jgi:hypothetical protein